MKIKQATHRSPRIEMLPLIDVVFLLLVVFIYAMLSMAVHKGMPVALPASTVAESEHQAVTAVTVTVDGAVFVNQKPTALDDLQAVLEQLSGNDKEMGVLVFADRNLTYQTLFRVLDQVRRAGLHRVSLQAEDGVAP